MVLVLVPSLTLPYEEEKISPFEYFFCMYVPFMDIASIQTRAFIEL